MLGSRNGIRSGACFTLGGVSPWIGCLILEIALACRLLSAQSVQEPLKIGSVTVQGNIRTLVEGWRCFEGQANSDYAFSGSFLRLTFSHQSPSFDCLLDFDAPILLGSPPVACAPGAQG